jgi:hypothetical protein
MMNVFEPVRVNGKLMAKCIQSGEFAAEGLIRPVQLVNAEKLGQNLLVTPTGRVTRIDAPTSTRATTPGKLSFLSVIETRDPEVMFNNLERLTKMVGRGIQPSLRRH